MYGTPEGVSLVSLGEEEEHWCNLFRPDLAKSKQRDPRSQLL
jgi:hypothetical protein